MLTQGGVVPYVLVRDRGFEDFSRLIDRERIELVQPRFQSDGLPGGQPLSVRIDRPFEAAQFANLPQIRQERNTSFQALLRDLYDQIERDRLENLVVLVPPGGLPPGLEQSLTVFKAKLAKGVDVRLDIAIVGSESIPTTLRDLCAIGGFGPERHRYRRDRGNRAAAQERTVFGFLDHHPPAKHDPAVAGSGFGFSRGSK